MGRQTLLWLIGIVAVACGDDTRACEPGSFFNDEIAQCQAWAACPAGAYVAQEGTATTDRLCAACETGFSQTQNATACSAWSVCTPGTYLVAAGTSTTDATCDACDAGTFAATENATSCLAFSDCMPSEWVMMEGTPSSDRMCAACTEGYTTEINAPACLAWRTCPAGEYMTADGTSTSNRECSACVAGTYTDEINDPSCQTWSTCDPGSYVATDGTAASDRLCTTCEGGTYSTTPNAVACLAWRDCLAGSYITADGTPVSDRECSGCSAGAFTDESNEPSCQLWRDCAAGNYVANPGTASTDRSCSGCNEGTFSTAPNAGSCLPWTECTSPLAQNNTPSNVVDRTCGLPWNTELTGGTPSEILTAIAAGSGQTQCVTGYITTGIDADILTACYDLAGTLLWQDVTPGGVPRDIVVDSAGRIAVVGRADAAFPHGAPLGSDDGFMMVYEADGTFLWGQRFGDVQANEFRAVAATGTTFVAVATSTTQHTLREYNAGTGALVASVNFGMNVAMSARHLSLAPDGSALLVAVVSGAFNASVTPAGGQDLLVLSFSPTRVLARIWQGGTAADDVPSTARQFANGTIRIAGTTTGSLTGAPNSNSNWFSLTLSAAGTITSPAQGYIGAAAETLECNLGEFSAAGAVSLGCWLREGASPQPEFRRGALLHISPTGALVHYLYSTPARYEVIYDALADDLVIYGAGHTYGQFPGQQNAGNSDGLFVREEL